MERKLYKCKHPNCNAEQTVLSKGLCKYHRSLEKGTPLERYKIKIKRKAVSEIKKNKKEILSYFFNYHLEKVKNNPYCENCGVRIQGNINNLAHILPKRYGGNPEVMGELDNCLYLCASVNGNSEIGCHERMDRIQGSTQFYLMDCFKKALNKYLKFKHNVVKYNKYVGIFEDYTEENNVTSKL